MTPLRKCRVCGLEAYTQEDLELFRKSRQNSTYGRENHCKKCYNKRQRELEAISRKENPEYWRRRSIKGNLAKSNMDITLDEYLEIMDAHDHCEICGVYVEGTNKHLDHDHETGKVRGVLCHKCNMGLGLFQDSPTLLNKVIEYINKYKE